MATKRVDQLSDEEILAKLAAEKAERERLIAEARANLEKYGSALPPVAGVTDGAVIRLAPRARTKRAIDPKWARTLKTCPHCGEEKNVADGFGVVIIRGREQAAGWCRDCRAGTNYHARPRKNQPRTPKATGSGPGRRGSRKGSSKT